MLGASQPRNEKLAILFYRMKLIEAYVEGAFRVVLPNMHAQKLSVEDAKYLPIRRLFEKQNEITRSDVEKALGVGTTHATNMLKEMLEKELIKKVGSGRLTRYVMK